MHLECKCCWAKCQRRFWVWQKNYEISEEQYQALRQIIDALLKTTWIRDSVSSSFLEGAIINWCRSQLKSEEVTLSDFIISECRKAITDYQVWVPIAHLEIQNPIRFGVVSFETISKNMLDEKEQQLLAKSQGHGDSITKMFEKLRPELQGLAAVQVNLSAEPNHAFTRAIDVANAAVGLLRFYSLAAISPWVLCPCAVIGSDFIPQAKALLFSEPGRFVSQKRYWPKTCIPGKSRPPNWSKSNKVTSMKYPSLWSNEV